MVTVFARRRESAGVECARSAVRAGRIALGRRIVSLGYRLQDDGKRYEPLSAGLPGSKLMFDLPGMLNRDKVRARVRRLAEKLSMNAPGESA